MLVSFSFPMDPHIIEIDTSINVKQRHHDLGSDPEPVS